MKLDSCTNMKSFDFVFTAWCYTECGIATASCPSICLSITLKYHDHIGWKSSKIISQLVSLGCSLSADPNIASLLQGEHPKILAGIGVAYGKKIAFGIEKL